MPCCPLYRKIDGTFWTPDPLEIEARVPIEILAGYFDDVTFWRECHHDFLPDNPMISMEQFSEDKTGPRKFVVKRKKDYVLHDCVSEKRAGGERFRINTIYGTVRNLFRSGVEMNLEFGGVQCDVYFRGEIVDLYTMLFRICYSSPSRK